MKNRSVFALMLSAILLLVMPSISVSAETSSQHENMPVIDEKPDQASGQASATVDFNDKDPFVQKTYLVNVIQRISNDLMVAVSRGSGFIFEKNGNKYFVTAAHVVNIDNVAIGDLKILFSDYKGESFNARFLSMNTDYDLALFAIDDQKILPRTVIKKAGSAKIEEAVITCGNFMLGQITFPVAVEKTVKGKINIYFADDSGNSDILTYLVVHTGIEFGFSGGPTMNKNGELLGVNVKVTRAGQFGILVGSQQNVEKLISSYEKTLKK